MEFGRATTRNRRLSLSARSMTAGWVNRITEREDTSLEGPQLTFRGVRLCLFDFLHSAHTNLLDPVTTEPNISAKNNHHIT